MARDENLRSVAVFFVLALSVCTPSYRPVYGQAAATSKPAGARSTDAKPVPAKPALSKPAAATAVPRAADGHPDINGFWNKVGGGLQEANPPQTQISDDQTFGVRSEPKGFTNVTGEPRAAPLHPSGVVNPANKVLPWRPEADERRREFVAKMMPPPSLEYVELSARCSAPGPWSGGPMLIVQRPAEIVMVYEGEHASRSIYLDRKDHVAPAIGLFMGDAVGHWEGDTLVVETTNLNGKAAFGRSFPYYSNAMHLTERFTMADAATMMYEIVYDDPKLFTRPIKSVGYLSRAEKNYLFVPTDCAEGSHTLTNMFGY